MKVKAIIVILLASAILYAEKQISRETIIQNILNSYYMRVEDDELKRLKVLKVGIERRAEEIGLTYDQMICSTAVILRSMEPDIKKWPQKVIEEKKDSKFLILLYILSINGDSSAINTMKELLFNKSMDTIKKRFAAKALFHSPTPWFPVAEYIVEKGPNFLRYLLYEDYLKKYVLSKRMANETLDSVARIMCSGIRKENGPSLLLHADSSLLDLFSNDYRYCKERVYILKERISSNEFQDYLAIHSYEMIDLRYIQEKINVIAKSGKLHSSPRFRKYFNITEDLDTVDIRWEEE